MGCSPAWLHNHLVAKDRVFLTAHSGLNFFIGNHAEATGYPRVPPGMAADQKGMLLDSITFAEEAAGRPLKRSEVSAYWGEQAADWIEANRGDWLRLLVRKQRNFWNAFEYDDISVIRVFQDAGITRPGLGWGVLVVFGVAGAAVLGGWREPKVGWVLAGVGLHLASLLSVFVTERYRLAAAPGLAILAGVSLAWIAVCVMERRWKALALPVAGAGVGLLLTAGPLPPADVWSVGEFNTGLAALETGQLRVAKRRLESSLARAPDSPEVIFSLGNLLNETGRTATAARMYQRTLLISPRHHRAANNLGVLFVMVGDWEQAKRLLEHAIRLDPDDAERWFLMAQIEHGLGNDEAAEEAIRRALAFRPGFAPFEAFADTLRTRNSIAP